MYSLLTNTFFESKETYLGYGETAAGIGLTLGPIIGGYLYSTYGYFECYLFLAGFISLDVIFTMIMMPGRIPVEVEIDNLDDSKRESISSKDAEDKVKYSWFLFNRRALFSYLCVAMSMVIASFRSSLMTPYLQDEKGICKEWFGWIIGIPPLFYVISGNLVGKIVDKAPRRVFLLIAFAIMSVSTFMLGPSKLLSFPDKVWILLAGLVINAIAQGFIFIPALPEAIESVYQKK
jgi:predicted MFS family arabinose efflux permease